jgi:hypothetical protein
MTSSPPPEALEFRGKTLTPVSPKPVHYPSPSNIPFLENQDELNLQMTGESGAGHPAGNNVPSPPPDMTQSLVAGQTPDAQALLASVITPDLQNLSSSAAPGSGGVDFKALLDNLSAASNIPAPSVGGTPGQSFDAGFSESASMNNGANLPPRPPPQEKPATHPNYAPSDDIRSYHPHSQKNPSASYRSQAGSTGAVGANGLPPPPTPSFQQNSGDEAQSPTAPVAGNSDEPRQKDRLADEDVQWGAEVQKLYDEFLQSERMYVTEGQWDKFPPNSRLFIGM